MFTKQKQALTAVMAVLLLAAAVSLMGCNLDSTSGSGQMTSKEFNKQCSVAAEAAHGLAYQVVGHDSPLRTLIRALGHLYNPGMQIAADNCPAVTIVPPIDTWTVIPSTVTLTMDYGSGCEASPGIVMSGSMVAVLTNITVTNTMISANYDITANNVVQNGTAVADGKVTGWVRATVSGDIMNVSAEANFTNFNAGGVLANGQLTVTAENINTAAGTIGTVTITLNNFSLQGLVTADNCVMTISPMTGGYHVVITGNTSLGALDLEATVATPSSNVYVFNTTRTGYMAGYSVTMTDVTLNTDQCTSNPISGTMHISGGGQTYGKTFTGACDGDWGIPGLDGGGGGGGGGSATVKWGVYNRLCCNSGASLDFSVTMDGTTRSSVSNGCSSNASWQGYASTTPGGGKVANYYRRGCGVDHSNTWSLSTNFEANNCYQFRTELEGSTIKFRLYRVTDCSSPVTASGVSSFLESNMILLDQGQAEVTCDQVK